MKNAILSAVLMVFGAAAHADGFVCDNAETGLRLRAYHHTQPELGTRNVAALIVSDQNVAAGRKTIATFDADKAVVTSKSATYTANVDLRFSGASRKGENIGGTKLGELDSIVLNVYYSFANPVPAGSEVDGEVTLVRRQGEDIVLPVTCTRYLKN